MNSQKQKDIFVSEVNPIFNSSLDSIRRVDPQEVNPNLGFNSTSQRFSYMQELNNKSATPGPGSYEDTSTINAKVKATRKT